MKRSILLKYVTLILFITLNLQAATPVVNTTINLSKTGSEPFDATTWDGADLTLAGKDADEDNNIVRMQDSVTYKVEVSVNDASVDNLVATVLLPDGKQKWITIPTGCETDAALYSPVSSISADGYTLTCNVGKGIEGTTKVFYPASKVVSYNDVAAKPVLNDEHTIARVTATAPGTGANVAAAGDTDVTITAGFKVDTVKELLSMAKDKYGQLTYKAPYAAGPNGEAGTLMEWRIKVRYQNGSMMIDSDENTYEVDINLFDTFTDDNTGNNGALSTGGKLYTWNASKPACSLDGNHGANAAVVCTQNNIAGDFLSDTADANGDYANTADGLNDPNIDIALSGIDVRDPDADGNVVELILNVWFSLADDVQTHQTCAGGTCIDNVINTVGVLENGAIKGYNPVSTEDAGNNNLLNYNGAGEPFANEIDYPMEYANGGYFVVHKSFNGLFDYVIAKAPDQDVSKGATIPFILDHFDYRNYDVGRSQACDKIDTKVFEYKGLAAPGSLIGKNEYYSLNRREFNPSLNVLSDNWYEADGSDLVKFWYSNQIDGTWTIEEQALATCEDDVNGDGAVVFQLANGSKVDANGAVASGDVDWYADYTAVPGEVARLRQDVALPKEVLNAVDPAQTKAAFAVTHLVKVKEDAVPYGPNDYLPNFMTYRTADRNGNYSSWYGQSIFTNGQITDPAHVSFSLSDRYADRMHLVTSSISIKKRTEPKGLKVVKAGDLVDFIITPGIFGLWTGEETATVSDAVPAGTKYVAGSEMFSVDGGTTWLSYDDYQALANPDATLTSAANSAGASPLVWEFGALTPKSTGSDKLPIIKYTVEVDPTATSASYTNTATLTSNIDNNNSDSPVKATYNIKVLPSSGFEVLKMVDKAVHEINTPFTFDLVYKNLGGETYSNSEFIDILPHNADGAGVSSGLASARTPATTYNGSYVVSTLSGTNSETFMMTSADPTTIPQDPCHEDNQPAGYVPVAGELCYNFYISSNTAGTPVKVANTFAGGGAQGTGTVTWVSFVANTAGTTAIRFAVPSIASTAGAKTVKLELTPTGNKGGVPDLDAAGKVTAASTGDVYTNSFGGRVPEISLVTISNDVSVTMIAGSIGDYVWSDENGDGVQDATELPLVNVTLKLLDGAGNPIMVDSNGTVVPSGTAGAVAYTTQTDASGKYLFENLPSGDYQVEVDSTTLPVGALQTYDADGVGTANTSSHTLTSALNPVTGELQSVENNEDQDFGYRVPKGSLSGHVNHELADSSTAPLAGVTLTLHHTDGTAVVDANNKPLTVTTNANGEYSFADLIPGEYIVRQQQPEGYFNLRENAGGADDDNTTTTGENEISAKVDGDEVDTLNDFVEVKAASLGDKVWNDENQDGIQDSNEMGVEGVKVYLLDANGSRVMHNGAAVFTQTDSKGEYRFNGLNPLKEYAVEFDLSTLPPRYQVTLEGEGTEETDSDANPQTGKTENVSLHAGEHNANLDLGIYAPTAHIGDYFWIDVNANGIQDAGEEAVVGAKVELFDAQGNPITDENGNSSVITDANGKYGFDVEPGTYQVKFNIPTSGYKGYVFSNANKGDDTKDTDVNGKGFTQTVTVTTGQNVLTLDAGINCGCSNVSSDSSDAQSTLSMLAMMLFTLMTALYFVRREEIEYKNENE